MDDSLDARLINQATTWGTTVSEAAARRTTISKILLLIACVLLAAGSILLIPLMAGTLLFTSTGAATELLVVGAVLVLALLAKKKSGDLPRNALQIDYYAGEIRLGTELPGGVFQREQVIGFRDIDEVYVDDLEQDAALCIRSSGDLTTLNFHKAEAAGLKDLVSKISAARESALQAPIRSRIQSRIRGFEASLTEVTNRVRSRITRPI